MSNTPSLSLLVSSGASRRLKTALGSFEVQLIPTRGRLTGAAIWTSRCQACFTLDGRRKPPGAGDSQKLNPGVADLLRVRRPQEATSVALQP